MSAKRLRTGGKVSRTKYWDALPWKAIDTPNEDLGDFEESVFFGLEELDGNAYLINKDKDGFKPEVVGSEGETTETGEEVVKEKKSKKAKRAKKSIDLSEVIEATPEVVSTPVINITDAISTEEPKTEPSEVVEVSGKKPKRVLTVEEKIEKYKKIAEKKQKYKKLRDAEAGITSETTTTAAQTKALAKGEKPLLNESCDWGGIQLNSLLYNSLIKLNFESPTPIQLAAIPRIIAGGSDIVGAAETGSGKTLVSVGLH